MANIIAIVWDFDKTLIKEYMQTPIFDEYGIDQAEFWKEVEELPNFYMKKQGVKVNSETIYLNELINYAKDGRFKGLTNSKLREYGKQLKFYDGVPEIFKDTAKVIEDNPVYREYNIKVEHYIVSTGLAETIRGSKVKDYVEEIWGCEFIEGEDLEGTPCISEIGYTIDNTSKTRALFEINKGVNKDSSVEVNMKIPKNLRRVNFNHMIYVADGPSDIPAFSVVNGYGGATFAVYPKGDSKALSQVEQMRKDGRINMYAEADYSGGTMASMWLCNKVRDFAENIVKEERENLSAYTDVKPPRHLND